MIKNLLQQVQFQRNLSVLSLLASFLFKFFSLFLKVRKQTNTSRFINRKSLPPLTRHILNAPALRRLTNWPITNSQFETIAQRKGQKIIWVKPINCLRVNAWQIQSHSEQFSASWRRFLGKWKKSRLKLCRYTVVATFWAQMVKAVAFSSIHLKSQIDSALIVMKTTAVWSIINVSAKTRKHPYTEMHLKNNKNWI